MPDVLSNREIDRLLRLKRKGKAQAVRDTLHHAEKEMIRQQAEWDARERQQTGRDDSL
jgi:hypothetical protein